MRQEHTSEMSAASLVENAPSVIPPKRLKFFERYLTIWVALCMGAGLALGTWAPAMVRTLRNMEFGQGSQVNVPIAVLIWLMIIPMMMKVDFRAIVNVRQKPRGLLVTLFVNWLVKPFSMALIGWVFFRHVFSAWISPGDADQYIAGVIILAAAPCTAMVFVWSYLTEGDPAYTLVQVSVNDLIMLFLFAPIVRFLVSGASSLTVPFSVLLYSVIAFIVMPLAVGVILRLWLTRTRGKDWFESAGTRPVGLKPNAVTALSEVGIDISGNRSKSVNEFTGQQFDYVFTVCDNARESCPIFPRGGKRIHQSFEDPAAAPADQQLATFRKVRDQISNWLSDFVRHDKG